MKWENVHSYVLQHGDKRNDNIDILVPRAKSVAYRHMPSNLNSSESIVRASFDHEKSWELEFSHVRWSGIMITDRIWNYDYSSMYKIVLMIVLWCESVQSDGHCQWYSVNPQSLSFPQSVRYGDTPAMEHINHLTLQPGSIIICCVLFTILSAITMMLPYLASLSTQTCNWS